MKFGFAAAILALLAVLPPVCYLTAAENNTDAGHFDAILVLGTPADADGGVSYSGKWLVDEAAREYRAGRAAHIILSGGAVANRYREAEVLARYASRIGLPDAAIVEENQSRDTLENIQNSVALMQQHGWRTMEVIGLKEHLPRAGVLLEHTSMEWATRAAATPDRSTEDIAIHTVEEAFATAVLRIFGLWTVPALHRLKVALRLH